MKGVILLAEGFEEIEALCTVDILRRANVEIDMVSITENVTVVGGHGIPVVADKVQSEVSDGMYDFLVLPGGGIGVGNLSKSVFVNQWIDRFVQTGKIVAAICAAPSLLKDWLQGKQVTGYPGVVSSIEGIFYTQESVAKDGNFITGKAMGSSIEFALAVLEAVKGREAMLQIKESILF